MLFLAPMKAVLRARKERVLGVSWRTEGPTPWLGKMLP